MPLQYLDFEYTEDTEGVGTFEAMASVWPPQLPALQAEIVRVLDWALHAFAGRRGPPEEGGDWDYDLHGQQEITVPQAIVYDERARRLAVTAGQAGPPRHTVTLTLSGTAEFCAALRQQFGLD